MRKIESTTIIILLISLSCNSCKPYHRIVYHNGNQRILLNIPKGFESKKFNFESVKSYGYKYKDSSILYITDEPNGGINYYNINAAGKWDSLQFMALEKDTIFLSGADEKGHLWRFDFYGTFGIGYKNVPKEKKEMFEKSVTKFKIK